MGPERGELFMRQRYKDRIGVEFEPPLIEDGTDGYDEAGGDMGVDMPTSRSSPSMDTIIVQMPMGVQMRV